MKKMVNGVEVDMTESEIMEYNQMQLDWQAGAAARMISEFTVALEKAINDKAQERTYSSALSCASYVNSTNPVWVAEAQAFIVWRDNCFAYSYDYLAKVQGGEILNPNVDGFLAGLPALTWPDAV